jgi:hypothetical protein
MATLNIDTEQGQPEFNEAEQEALAVGEELQQQEEAMLAGKFKDAEELEKAYIELQQKLGQGKDEEEPEGVRDEKPEAEEVDEEDVGEEEPQPTQYTDEHVTAIKNIAGGEQEYEDMLKWAASNLSKEDIASFDEVISLNNPNAAAFAVRVLSSIYKDANGSEGELLTGGSSSEPADVYKSQAQVIEAMGDPRYDRDPAYREEVMHKLERSNIQF